MKEFPPASNGSKFSALTNSTVRNDLDTATVFSGLFTVILIGLFVESVIFRAIEARTVNLWGMQR